MVKKLPVSAGDIDLIPGSRRSPGEGNGYPFQYSCLRNHMDRGSWQAAVHWVTKHQTWLSTQHPHDTLKEKLLALWSLPYIHDPAAVRQWHLHRWREGFLLHSFLLASWAPEWILPIPPLPPTTVPCGIQHVSPLLFQGDHVLQHLALLPLCTLERRLTEFLYQYFHAVSYIRDINTTKQ